MLNTDLSHDGIGIFDRTHFVSLNYTIFSHSISTSVVSIFQSTRRGLLIENTSFDFQRGESIFLIWAYHSTNDVPNQFSKHSFRGFQQVTLIPGRFNAKNSRSKKHKSEK